MNEKVPESMTHENVVVCAGFSRGGGGFCHGQFFTLAGRASLPAFKGKRLVAFLITL